MAVRDQYYIPRTSEADPSEPREVLDSEEKVQQALEALFETDWVNWGEISSQEKNITLLIHGPSSLLDMRRLPDTDVDTPRLVDPNGRVLQAGESGPEVGLLPCENLGTQWITDYIYQTAESIDMSPEEIERVMESLDSNYKEVGAFQPYHLGKFSDDAGVNPVLFSVAMALKVKKEAMEHNHTGRLCVVSHPDQLYFIGNGKIGSMRDSAKTLGEFYGSLGMELYLENPLFTHPVFKQAFDWMENPCQLADLLVGDGKKIGLCVDCQHLEKLGYDGEQIDGLLKELLQKKTSLAVHLDAGYSANQSERPYILTAYQSALSIAYEPRGVI